MSALLLYGDTEHSAALRHEVPIAIIDPLLYAEDEGRTWIMSSSLERQRLASCRPDVKLLDIDELGLRELVGRGLNRNQISLELASRAAAQTAITEAIVDFDFPLAVADRLRSDRISLRVDNSAVTARRRRKSSHELAGIRRAQLAAEAAMAAAASLLGRAEVGDGSLLSCSKPRGIGPSAPVQAAIRAKDFSFRWAMESGCASTKRRPSGGPATSRWSRVTCWPSSPGCGSARSAA